MQVNMTLLADLTARVTVFHTISISHLATSFGTVGNPSTDMLFLGPTRRSSTSNGLHEYFEATRNMSNYYPSLWIFLKQLSCVGKNGNLQSSSVARRSLTCLRS